VTTPVALRAAAAMNRARISQSEILQTTNAYWIRGDACYAGDVGP
jgi:hypothetical protein